MKVRIGTRGSRLALAQARHVAEALARIHPDVEVETVIVQSQGDRLFDAPLSRIAGKGVFTKEIEEALLDGRTDLAVHSLKDLPTADAPGLRVAAIPPRESPWDVLVAPRPLQLGDLPAGSVIGTSSLRRASQLRARHPHLEIRELRGNVPTRIRKMLEGRYAAIVLAEAGLNRLALEPPFAAPMDADTMLPAPGQGALGLQIREQDTELAEVLAALNHEETAACCTAERTLLDRLGGGCQVPLGAFASMDEHGRITLRARVLSQDGRTTVESVCTGTDPVALGEQAAEELKRQGADALIAKVLESAPETAAGVPGHQPAGIEPRVIVTRDEDADGPLSRELRNRGMVPVCLPLVRTRLLAGALEGLAKEPFHWAVLTSANAVDALSAAPEKIRQRLRDTQFACVGKGTAEGLEAAGFRPGIVGSGGREELLQVLLPRIGGNARVLLLRGNLAPPRTAEALRAHGCEVTDLVVYETQQVPESAGLLASLLRSGDCRAIAFCSSSAADAFAELEPEAPQLAGKLIVASIGESTSETLRQRGMRPVTAPEPSFVSLSECLRRETT